MTAEIDIMNLIRIALSERGIISWRNNTGALKDITGRLVRYGLGIGSSDIIGIMPDGRFLAIEVKKPGKNPTSEQINLIQAVRKHGGVGGVARCVADLDTIL